MLLHLQQISSKCSRYGCRPRPPSATATPSTCNTKVAFLGVRYTGGPAMSLCRFSNRMRRQHPGR